MMNAVSHHGIAIVAYLDAYGRDGVCPSAKHLYVGETHLTIGLDAYDAHAVRLSREQCRALATLLRHTGMEAFLNKCAQQAIQAEVKRNPPVAILARSFKHRPSHLHRSKKTAKAKIATSKGRKQDAERARVFNLSCSTPSMMSHGRNKDPKPVTIHTSKPIGLNA
jgi:hypothetical protein